MVHVPQNEKGLEIHACIVDKALTKKMLHMTRMLHMYAAHCTGYLEKAGTY